MLILWEIFLFCLFFSTLSFTPLPENHPELNEEQTINNTSVTLKSMITECSILDKHVGYCMKLEKCPKLLKQQNNKTIIKALQCGPKNKDEENPLVCCIISNKQLNLNKTEKNPLPKICGQHQITMETRIIGGTEASLGEFPWLARLIHKNSFGVKTFGCTGFLIAQKFVLTAAHCLKSDNIKFLGPLHEIHLGEHNTERKTDCDTKTIKCSDKKQIIKVQKILVHNSYSVNFSQHHHDIGLIYLKKGAKFSEFVSPICLSKKNDAIEYWLSGWGTTEKGSESPVKLKVSVPPYNFNNCTIKYKKLNMKIIDKQLCAGGRKNEDSCNGDSGGPLMFMDDKNRWVAAGVVSYGIGCGRDNWPGVYTNISKYIDWIKKTISDELNNDKMKKQNVKN